MKYRAMLERQNENDLLGGAYMQDDDNNCNKATKVYCFPPKFKMNSIAVTDSPARTMPELDRIPYLVHNLLFLCPLIRPV